jgi:hypothetical protein
MNDSFGTRNGSFGTFRAERLMVSYRALRGSESDLGLKQGDTTLDDLIAAQTQKLETLKTHKKGLMQQLFPSPEDTTNP